MKKQYTETEETRIKREVKKFLELSGFKVKRLHSGRVNHHMHNNETGTLDLLAIGKYGFIVFIEVKVPGKEATAKQQEEIDELREMGHEAIVIHGVAEMIDYLTEMYFYIAQTGGRIEKD